MNVRTTQQNKNYNKIPTLYRVWNAETGEVYELLAKNNLDALCQISEETDPFIGPWHTKHLLTPEGYGITKLRFIPQGTHFNLVAARGTKPTPTRTYIRGKYNHSENAYECCYFKDIDHWRLLNGNLLVTIDSKIEED